MYEAKPILAPDVQSFTVQRVQFSANASFHQARPVLPDHALVRLSSPCVVCFYETALHNIFFIVKLLKMLCIETVDLYANW